MAAKPTVSKVSARQRAADKANLGKARAVARLLPRSAKQKSAARQNLVKARAAQKSRRSGKGAVTARKPAAPVPAGYEPVMDIHSLPACAAVAMAASLQAWGGPAASAAEIIRLYERAGAVTLGGMCEAVTGQGLAGWRLAWFAPADLELPWPGMVYGVRLDAGYHAVLRTPAGMMSWGLEIPLAGQPEEAWMLEWEAAGGAGA